MNTLCKGYAFSKTPLAKRCSIPILSLSSNSSENTDGLSRKFENGVRRRIS